jgi:hypothetical protein
MTPEQLKHIWETNPDKLTQALAAVLVDFGYRDLRAETVQQAISRYYAGATNKANVIDGFVSGWLANGLD